MAQRHVAGGFVHVHSLLEPLPIFIVEKMSVEPDILLDAVQLHRHAHRPESHRRFPNRTRHNKSPFNSRLYLPVSVPWNGVMSSWETGRDSPGIATAIDALRSRFFGDSSQFLHREGQWSLIPAGSDLVPAMGAVVMASTLLWSSLRSNPSARTIWSPSVRISHGRDRRPHTARTLFSSL